MKRLCLLTLFFLLVLVGCGSAVEGETAVSDTGGAAVGGDVSALQVILVSTDFAVGQSRVSFALFDGAEAATNVTAINVVAVEPEVENAAPAWQGAAENYSDYEVPYWVIYPELPKAGFWGMIAQITLDDGSSSEAQFVISVAEVSESIAVGVAAPASDNRTVADEPDLQKLSSGNDPNPDLYQMTIAAAVGSEKPTVVAFATPGLCQTQWCVPVLESVEAVMGEAGDGANFIHVEVYEDFQALTLVPEMAEWGLQTEPWIFVLDEKGSVAAKLSGPVSAQELRDSLAGL